MKIIFMGTPEFAAFALQELLDSGAISGNRILAAYSQPPRPAGRGQKLTPSPIQKLAEAHGIPVHTPLNFKSAEEIEILRAYKADIAVVAAYGMLLPKTVLESFPYGCINIHPSLLPRWRGAAPLQRTLMAGDSHTAVAIMQMEEGLDTGPILLQHHYDIPEGTTAAELHDTLGQIGAKLLIEALEGIAKGSITPTPQAEEGVTYARKIRKEEARIHWQRPARELLHHIHGLSPFPGAYFLHEGEHYKILKAELVSASDSHAPGTVLDERLAIACGAGSLRPTLIQRAGKKALPLEEFLRGNALPAGTVLQ
jgi:methionyl-tRNA formyltransferase